MNGSAPNCPATGSHVCVTKKCHPNWWRERAEFTHNSYTSANVTSTILSAAPRTRSSATLSPLTIRRKRAPVPALGTGALELAAETTASDTFSLYGRNRLQLFRDHGLRQLRKRQHLGHPLAIGQHPLEEVRDDFLLRGILDLCGDQQPCEARDRVCRLAGSVGDRDAEVVGHVRCR